MRRRLTFWLVGLVDLVVTLLIGAVVIALRFHFKRLRLHYLSMLERKACYSLDDQRASFQLTAPN